MAINTIGFNPLLAIAALGCAPSASAPRVAQFETPAWTRPGKLYLRLDGANTDGLLLRQDPTEAGGAAPASGVAVIYRHRSGKESLEHATLADWESASEAICDCDMQQAVSATPLRIDGRTNTLHHGERPVPTAGKTVLNVLVAPGGNEAAVLSAEGPRVESVASAIGRGGATGRHYHQAFSLSEGKPVGESISLPLSSARTTLGTCWSADGRWVVYFDVLFRQVCILDLTAGQEGNGP